MTTPSTIRVVIPLKVKHRNGRPSIVPPADLDAFDKSKPDPRTLRAIARAWDWRRRLERGEAATLSDIAQAGQVTLPFVSRYIRLAYLSPTVLERLLIHRRPGPPPSPSLPAVRAAIIAAFRRAPPTTSPIATTSSSAMICQSSASSLSDSASRRSKIAIWWVSWPRCVLPRPLSRNAQLTVTE
jgi:hypothetical protein